MSSSSEEEYDGVWSRGMVKPYQCEPLARPRASKPLPAKPKIIVDRSIGYPPDATQLFAPDSPTTEEDEEVEEEEEVEERIQIIEGGGGSSVHGQPFWLV